MTLEGAVIREQGVTFAVVIVKPSVVRIRSEGQKAIATFASYFGMPTVLMAQDAKGVPTYFGRPDIVRFLSNVEVSRIPWKRYTIT